MTILPSGVCHADDLWHIFNYELPFVLCDIKPILADLTLTVGQCVLTNATGVNVDYAQCLTRPNSQFIKNSGECINGTLTDEDMLTSYNMVKTFISFVKDG